MPYLPTSQFAALMRSLADDVVQGGAVSAAVVVQKKNEGIVRIYWADREEYTATRAVNLTHTIILQASEILRDPSMR